MEFGEIEPVKAGAEARHPKEDGFGEVEPVNDGFGEMEPVNDGFGEVEPVESKQDLGFWERKRLELEAKTGDKTSWGELAVNKTVGFGIDELKETVDEYSEQRLMKGEEDNPLKMVELARRIGLTQEQIDKVTARADSGKRSIGGFKLAPNADVLKQGFAELAKAKVAERVRTREAAQERLANAEEQSTMGAIAGGVVDMVSMPLKFANPATIGATTMINIASPRHLHAGRGRQPGLGQGRRLGSVGACERDAGRCRRDACLDEAQKDWWAAPEAGRQGDVEDPRRRQALRRRGEGRRRSGREACGEAWQERGRAACAQDS